MRFTTLGQTGLRISDIALGTANFGTGWGHGASPEEASAIYARYRDAGGIVIDTASNYQGGQSEEIVGKLIKADRDSIVLATKYSLGPDPATALLGGGNSRRAAVQSLEASLKRLGTDRVDLLWVHYPDEVTPIEEILRALDDLVRSGKVLYIGISNFPAWRISAAAAIASLRGWAPVAAAQFEYSLVERTPERELIPMANAYGLAKFGWSPLGGGLLTGKYRNGESGRLQALGIVIHQEDDERKRATLDALLSVAGETGMSPSQVAIAWSRQKGILPLIGPRTVTQIVDNLGAIDLSLSDEQIARLDQASAISLGFPHAMNAEAGTRDMLTGGRGTQLEWPVAAIA